MDISDDEELDRRIREGLRALRVPAPVGMAERVLSKSCRPRFVLPAALAASLLVGTVVWFARPGQEILREAPVHFAPEPVVPASPSRPAPPAAVRPSAAAPSPSPRATPAVDADLLRPSSPARPPAEAEEATSVDYAPEAASMRRLREDAGVPAAAAPPTELRSASRGEKSESFAAAGSAASSSDTSARAE